MGDETDQDKNDNGLTPEEIEALGDLDLGEAEGGTGVVPAEVAPSSAGRRLVGTVATVLGLVGVVVSVVLAVLGLRLLFTASSVADRAMSPIEAAFDRLEQRIDETDDLIDRQGVDAADGPELRARVDGLVDVASLANRGFETIDGHPLYRFLPADLAPLGESLASFEESAVAVDEQMGPGGSVRATAATRMADQIDGMQGRVTEARDRLDGATSSLRSWLRLGGLIGFLMALWGLWAQWSLVRRGWRGFRNRPV